MVGLTQATVKITGQLQDVSQTVAMCERTLVRSEGAKSNHVASPHTLHKTIHAHTVSDGLKFAFSRSYREVPS